MLLKYSYKTPENLIPKACLLARHNHVRSILKNSLVLDLGCNNYKIINNAVSFDLDRSVKPDVLGTALNLPFPDESFDTVITLELVEHFNRKEQTVFLKEIYKVLKNKGQFIVSTPDIKNKAFKKIHDFLWFISHFIYARKDLGQHVNELTNDQLFSMLNDSKFQIVKGTHFLIFNFVVECVKVES